MKRLGLGLVLAVLAVAALAPTALAAISIENYDVTFTNEDGSPVTQAGSHPYAMTTSFMLDYSQTGPTEWQPLGGDIKSLIADQVAGFVGDATAVPRCSLGDFLSGPTPSVPGCDNDTAVGLVLSRLGTPEGTVQNPVFNLEPPPGVAARLAFVVALVPVIIDVGVKQGGEYNIEATLGNTPQLLTVFGGALQLWGVPADPGHDAYRGTCASLISGESPPGTVEFVNGTGECHTDAKEKPFLTVPSSCTGPAASTYKVDSWAEPSVWSEGFALTHDDSIPPTPQGFSGCEKLEFSPAIDSKPTSDSAETGSGLDFDVDFNDEGLKNPDGYAQSEAKKVKVTLPEGVTVNPSIGEGLGVCTPADIKRETLHSAPGEGCPNASKIGTLHLETPLVDEAIDGSVFLAQQDDPATSEPGAENPFDSLIALYMVLRNTDLGVIVKLPLKVEPDPRTGQLVTTLENIPQVPFSHFNFHFREGQRAPLVTPSACGTYTTKAVFYPWSDPGNPRTVLSDFEVSKGIGGGACPPGGIPPFHPGFQAGSLDNSAGSFSPFDMRLIRADGEQDMTKFSATLPPGVLGSLAGVGKCPEAAIAAAARKSGREELAHPSCPASSLIGHTVAGAGVGGALTYVPGQIYLGGPYKGDPLSVVAITPAVAGPFDAGTVVVREALTLNPTTAEVEVDGAASDPIPHILKGIPLKLRDLRVHVDRPNFTINPTSCDESSAKATLFGSFRDPLSPTDDVPVGLSTRYQAADCLRLGFKPALQLKLKGGTKRGGHPALTANYRSRPGDANVKGLVVRLPRSAFLDQAHIRTICTRVQFAAKACPKGAQYGYIKAWTPLLDEPLEGPVYLRSSNHKLPDLVFDLHGLVDVEVATRIDSFHGGIRATVESAPDAPLSKVLLTMQGAKKGLIVNSRNLCGRPSKADAQFSAQNGKEASAKPLLRAQCGGNRKHKGYRG